MPLTPMNTILPGVAIDDVWSVIQFSAGGGGSEVAVAAGSTG